MFLRTYLSIYREVDENCYETDEHPWTDKGKPFQTAISVRFMCYWWKDRLFCLYTLWEILRLWGGKRRGRMSNLGFMSFELRVTLNSMPLEFYVHFLAIDTKTPTVMRVEPGIRVCLAIVGSKSHRWTASLSKRCQEALERNLFDFAPSQAAFRMIKIK